MSPAFPTALIKISARLATFAKSWVRLWQTVTVAPWFNPNSAIGRPTIVLWPIMTISFPTRSILYSLKNSMIPCGVHGTIDSSFCSNFPKFTGWNPSTSFSGTIASKTASVSMCFGRGNCTKIPWMLASWLSLFTYSNNSSGVVSSARRITFEWMPTSVAARSLLRTYTWLAGSSPTRMTVSEGVIPLLESCCTSCFSPSLIFPANAFPSRICVIEVSFFLK